MEILKGTDLMTAESMDSGVKMAIEVASA
jgi:hypothetical protein